MDNHISERVPVWSLIATSAAILLLIITLAGLLVPVMDSQISDIEGNDLVFDRDVPGGRVFRAESGSDVPGMMSISIDTAEGKAPRISVEVFEGRKKIMKVSDPDLPFATYVMVNGTGRMTIEVTIYDRLTYPEDLDLHISLPSEVGMFSFLCGLTMTPLCCMMWSISFCLALYGMVARASAKRSRRVPD